jgi:6-phosphofructokinase 1
MLPKQAWFLVRTLPQIGRIMLSPDDFVVSTLGERRYWSPLPMSTVLGDGVGNFVTDHIQVLYEVCLPAGRTPSDLAFEMAGARQHIFFDPPQTRAAIVTCGGLCPGLNNVIRTLFFELTVNYGIREVLGIRYGYEGLDPATAERPLRLTNVLVEEIHYQGGTILGTSRGEHDPRITVEYLRQAEIDMLFCLGGDGTLRGAHQIATEVARRRLPIAVVGIPKTIDNDIKFCQRSFGYFTAISEAATVIERAHTEATGIQNGVGLVKLMGREAGYIAAGATIASGQVNFTLIPEVPFELDGPHGLLARLERRLAARKHAVIVVAEGAGQELLPNYEESYDASGNRRLGDIGPFLKRKINEHFAEKGVPVGVKYFDPSYHIRSCEAGTADRLYCERLARNAAHAGMAGKTDLLVALWHDQIVHVPLALSAGQKKRMNPEDEVWTTVLAITGQEKW